MKKKNGFTLIELLAVIVILAIIALIAVPTVMNIINKANKSAFKDSAYGLIKAGELFYTDQLLENAGLYQDKTFTFPNDASKLEIKGSKPTGGYVTVNKEGQVSMAVTNGKYCVTKSFEDDDVTIADNVEDCIIPISITDITLTEESMTISKGETKAIELTILPNNATNKTLNYSSSDENVATIENGVITGIKGGTTTITISTTDGSNISKQIDVEVEELEPIMTSTNSCIQKGNTCSDEEIKAGVLVNVQVNDTKNYDFYVISNTADEVTLIMDRNLGEKVAWVSKVDYNDDTNYGSSGNNNKGPITALNYLNSQTKDWKNIPTIEEYTYNNNLNGTTNTYGYQKLEIQNGVGKLTSQDGEIETEVTGVSKARLLTYEEYNTIKTNNSNVTPTWLRGNLSSSNTTEKPYGYWLLKAYPSFSDSGCRINYFGDVADSNVTSDATIGVRPVITLSK